MKQSPLPSDDQVEGGVCGTTDEYPEPVGTGILQVAQSVAAAAIGVPSKKTGSQTLLMASPFTLSREA